MKNSRALFAFAMILASPLAPLGYAVDALAPVAATVPPEPFEAKVLKVFAAKEGTAIFRAYLVNWKGQEVIASDPLAKSDYKEGDTISVVAMNQPFPRDQESHRLLAFLVLPVRK